MRARPILGAVAGTAAIALATLLVASPAGAAPLPSGQRIDVIYSPGSQTGPYYGEMYQAEATLDDGPVTNLTAAPDGPQAGANYAYSVDVLDDGLGYAVIQLQETDSPQLWTVDANTGAITDPHDIVPADEDDELEICRGIDVQPSGQILVACFGSVPDEGDGRLDATFVGTIVLEPEGGDAVFTPVVTVTEEGEAFVPRLNALAINPVTGDVWAFGTGIEGTIGWYPVDLAGGTLGEMVPTFTYIFEADFDRDGQLWATGGGDSCDYMITVDPSTGEDIDYYGCWDNGDDITIRLDAITVWGAAPALPATGPAVTLPLGLGTALLFLAGAAFISWSRLRSTTGRAASAERS